MMENQRQNEMRWYAERQALRQSQGSRERATAQVGEILKGLSNGSHDDSPSTSTDVGNLGEELAKFDRKIYAAQLSMDATMTSELKGLGVPFFGTVESAVLDDDGAGDAMQVLSSRPKHSPLVTEKQLAELRRRMIEHLEALYRD